MSTVKPTDLLAITRPSGGDAGTYKVAVSDLPHAVPATETAAGIVELATAAETTTGTDDTRAVHPAGLKAELDSRIHWSRTGTTLSPTVTGDKVLSSDVSFTQAGTGAVARTVESKLKDVVSVKDFGAVGDGVTDDTAAIQAACAASNSIYFPYGTYVLKQESKTGLAFLYFNTKSNVSIVGDNATLKVADTSLSISTIIFLRLCFGSRVSGINIDGNVSNTGGGGLGIYLESGTDYVIDNCRISNIGLDGINVRSATPSDSTYDVNRVKITNCTVSGCARNNVALISCNDVLIDNIVSIGATGNPGSGLQIEPNDNDSYGVKNVVVSNSLFKNNVKGVTLSGNLPSGGSTPYPDGVTLTNLRFEGNTQQDILLNHGRNISLSRITNKKVTAFTGSACISASSLVSNLLLSDVIYIGASGLSVPVTSYVVRSESQGFNASNICLSGFPCKGVLAASARSVVSSLSIQSVVDNALTVAGEGAVVSGVSVSASGSVLLSGNGGVFSEFNLHATRLVANGLTNASLSGFVISESSPASAAISGTLTSCTLSNIVAAGGYTAATAWSVTATGCSVIDVRPYMATTSALFGAGSYTINFYDAKTGGNVSSSTATGYYTRTGNVVTVTGYCGAVDTTGMTAGNSLYFSLPFTTGVEAAGTGRFEFAATALPSGYSDVHVYTEANQARAFFKAYSVTSGYRGIKVANVGAGKQLGPFTFTFVCK